MRKEESSRLSVKAAAALLTIPLIVSSHPLFNAEASDTTDKKQTLIQQLNEFRAKHGKEPVHRTKATCNFALTRAKEITKNFNHDGFTKRVENDTLPYKKWSYATENLQRNSDPSTVIDLWIKSKPHRKNLLADTPQLCIKRAKGVDPDGNPTLFWAMEGKRN